MTANRAASIRVRLKQRADANKQHFNLAQTRYALIRLPCRSQFLNHAPSFLLKGALLFQLWPSSWCGSIRLHDEVVSRVAQVEGRIRRRGGDGRVSGNERRLVRFARVGLDGQAHRSRLAGRDDGARGIEGELEHRLVLRVADLPRQ